MIIAGDIGGTKTNIGLFRSEGQRLGEVVAVKSFPSSHYDSLEAIIGEFLAEHPSEITRACFGVAGPIVEGYVETSNLAWKISAASLASLLQIEQVKLINDLEATAYGVETLDESQLYRLSEADAVDEAGHRALIAAGTGLGMAAIFYDGRRYHPMSSEGGHVDLAPRNELEIELLVYLMRTLQAHVSYERVLSGPGLANIYAFLRERGYAPEPVWLASEIERGDPSAAISKAALARQSELAVKALDMFVELYGAMAGNLALILKPMGGLYVGGGIAPKILDKLKDGSFMRAFRDKGRLSYVIEPVPVYVILEDRAALYGAAVCALL